MSAFYRAGLILITVLPLVSCDQQKQVAKVPEKPGAELSSFIAEIKENLVYVEGGEFLMGDYGEQYGPEHLPYDARQHSKPLHKVELTGYSIGKFKTSNKEYQFYLAYNNLPGRNIDLRSGLGQLWREVNMTPETPAHVDWFEAENYCRWLATITKLPFSLPTEAQWEYAARSRGKFVNVPTDNGTIQIKERKGINITTSDDREIFAREQGTRLGILSPMPRDARPLNPLGIYDMAGNGWEWIKDWYDPDYYKYSPVKDPQGPEKPVFKDNQGNYTRVIRSQDYSGPRRGATIFRFFSDPANKGYLPGNKTVRCAVNSSSPLK